MAEREEKVLEVRIDVHEDIEPADAGWYLDWCPFEGHYMNSEGFGRNEIEELILRIRQVLDEAKRK